MNTIFTSFTPNEGWNMLKKAGENRYYLVAPKKLSGDLRIVLANVISQLLSDKHISMLAESSDPANLSILRSVSRESRILKRGSNTALFAELDRIPSPETFQALPHNCLFSLRFAGFPDTIPHELRFSGMIDSNCPADIVLDCTRICGRLSLCITFDPEKTDECILVNQVRQSVQDCGAYLHIDFAS